ncbi:MAG: acyl-CoA/acyl-ACP dehydrogenase [Chloroflexi bacterium]|nr:acyl-CoA/acyl-ACP dehydrogenase [Chloroflexota bacterium]MDA1217868.1 acyl-CoA/acyl-ACP dehydrogenase [Chloroflexota bacterium]PKB56985.1 MAG: hypothetical protein BZY73_05680 [SAR202 cluster bacterium Casp-Chloro-G3]
MDFEVSAEQLHFVSLAQRLAKESLAPRAEHYDEAGVHPTESWHDLWQNGFLAAAVPKEYGGLGLDMLTYCMVMEKLAEGCTSTAMTAHMHSTVMRFIDALGTDQQKSLYFSEVVNQGELFGSWGSEPESRGGAVHRQTTITPSGGGYVIDGEKHFCTMAGGAHRYMVHCSLEDADPEQALLLALVPHGTPGLNIIGDWNTLGMRATISPSVSFKDCRVGEQDVLGEAGQSQRLGVGLAFGLGYAAVYLGAAQAALDYTVEYCRTHHFDPDPELLAESLIVQRNVAEMTMSLEGAHLVVYQAASHWAESKIAERAIWAARAKYLATQASLSVTGLAIQTVGGRSAHKRMPLERIFRDVRTCTLMPPNLDQTMEIIGKAELGLFDALVTAQR